MGGTFLARRKVFHTRVLESFFIKTTGGLGKGVPPRLLKVSPIRSPISAQQIIKTKEPNERPSCQQRPRQLRVSSYHFKTATRGGAGRGAETFINFFIFHLYIYKVKENYRPPAPIHFKHYKIRRGRGAGKWGGKNPPRFTL